MVHHDYFSDQFLLQLSTQSIYHVTVLWNTRPQNTLQTTESRERLNHNQGLAEDNNVILKSDAEYKNVYHELQSIEMWPTHPSHYLSSPLKRVI